MSVCKYAEMTDMTITPTPVKTEAVCLARVGLTERAHTWSDHASTAWSGLAGMTWGSD